MTSYVCFWKPMHTNAAGIYWYMFKHATDSTLSKLEQRNTFCFKDFTQRTTSLVARWQAFAQQHFSNNTLCKKHDSRMVFTKCCANIATQILQMATLLRIRRRNLLPLLLLPLFQYRPLHNPSLGFRKRYKNFSIYLLS